MDGPIASLQELQAFNRQVLSSDMWLTWEGDSYSYRIVLSPLD